MQKHLRQKLPTKKEKKPKTRSIEINKNVNPWTYSLYRGMLKILSIITNSCI